MDITLNYSQRSEPLLFYGSNSGSQILSHNSAPNNDVGSRIYFNCDSSAVKDLFWIPKKHPIRITLSSCFWDNWSRQLNRVATGLVKANSNKENECTSPVSTYSSRCLLQFPLKISLDLIEWAEDLCGGATGPRLNIGPHIYLKMRNWTLSSKHGGVFHCRPVSVQVKPKPSSHMERFWINAFQFAGTVSIR